MRPRSRRVALWAGLILLGTLGLIPAAAPPAKERARPDRAPPFEVVVLPVFRAKCLRCHGEKVRRADLDLRTAAGALKGGESGPAVVPGSPDKSLLYEKVHAGQMPPGKKDRLSKDELAALRAWIAGGAPSGEKEGAPLTQHDVLPILLRRCTVCHGTRRREGGLDLHSRASMLRGGKSGPALVAGKPEKSLLITKVSSGAMPPPKRLVEVSVKPIEPAEIATLKRWIAQGAPEAEVAPDVATTKPDPLVSDRDRDFWSFRAPRPAAAPDVRPAAARNPIDAFVVQKLAKNDLSLSPEADRATLLRRAYFDLLGLPPSPEEVHAFLDDRSADAYERLIDRLLADPRYGERWGRRWLDAAGYADSEGKREQDLYRPHAWRYRDYVIRAFADDKPYDRFLLEQIAGDELADYERASRVTPELYDNLVATGFLRMAPDVTWANITGFVPDRIDVVSDEMDVLGSAVLGLTLKCARCHSHKFDPIPQRDYYRLVAIFKGAFDEYDWLKPEIRPGAPLSQDVQPGRHLPYVTTEERDAWKAHNQAIEKEIAALQARRASAQQVNALRARLLPEPRIQALWDRGEPSPTYVYRRGDHLTPGRLVGPGVPSVLTDGKTPFVVAPPWKGARKTGRRLAFAKWLTRPDNPLTARVMVNRVWRHHFGRGIVRTLGNFGKAGARLSHPELLDWLALEFVRSGWSVKRMHRLMMTSAVYRQSSEVTDEHEKRDPDNDLFSRMPMARLDAEALYDAMLTVAGQLDGARFGPGDPVTVRQDGLATPAGTSRGWRRLIYVRQMRKQLPTHLENFDFPQMSPNCLERRTSTVAPQALHLLNNDMVRTLAERFARRVLREAGADAGKQVERVHLIALSRPAGAEERRAGVEALKELAERWGGKDRNAKALTSYCHVMLNSAAFLYVD